MGNERVFDSRSINLAAQRMHGSDRRIVHAAGHNARKMLEIGMDIQGNAVKADPLAAANTGGSDL